MTHPKKWYIPVTEENHAELNRWRQRVATSNRDDRLKPYDSVVVSAHHLDGSYYYASDVKDLKANYEYRGYQEITLEQFREITKPQPEHWYIPVTQQNHAELQTWWRKQVLKSGWKSNPDACLENDVLLLSQHPTDDSYYYMGTVSAFKAHYLSYQEITLEQFRQITNSNQTTMSKSIQISRDLLNAHYEASTTPQREYLTEHFKLDGTTTDEAIRGLHDMACETWKPKIKKNHPDCFPEDSKYFDFSEYFSEYVSNKSRSVVSGDVCRSLGLEEGFIQVRNSSNPETDKRSFYLTSRYNWELVQDDNVMVLIPTKKYC